MKINVKELKNAVGNCALISPRKGNLPVIQMIRLEGRKSSLTLYATNLEEYFTVTMAVSEGEMFSALVVTEQLAKALKHVKTDDIELKVERGPVLEVTGLHMTSDTAFHISAENNVDDFPDLPAEESPFNAPVEFSNKKSLFEALRKISFCTTKHNVNKSYSGILFSQKEDHLELVATDIHRLSVVTTGAAHTKADFVMPVESIRNMMKIFDKSTVTSVVLDREHMDLIERAKTAPAVLIRVRSDNATYCSRLLKNEFPNYNQVINFRLVDDSWFEVEKKDILGKLKSMTDFHSSKKVVEATFDFVNDRLYISAPGLQNETVDADVAIKAVSEPEEAIKFRGLNVRYVHEAMCNMDSIRMNLEEGASLKPFYMLDVQPDYRFYHLIMPLRMEGGRSRKEKLSEPEEIRKAS